MMSKNGFIIGVLVASSTALGQSNSSAKPLLAGLFVNEKEVQSVDAYYIGKRHLLAFNTVIEYVGITPKKTEKGLLFETPLGTGNIPASSMQSIKNQVYIDLSSLKNIGVNATFDQSAYAIKMTVPWDRNSLEKAKKNNKTTPPKPDEPHIDYYPQTVGLNEISFSGEHAWQGNDDIDKATWSQSFGLGLSGNFFGGIWGGKLSSYQGSHSDSEYNITIENFYWTDNREKIAWRLGLNQPAYDTGNGGIFTGLSFAYSNEGIERHLSSPNSSTTALLQSNYQDYRTIAGKGPAGGIAELRINGVAKARVRIALDKNYEFKNLDVDQLYDNQYNVEIALYEHSISAPPTKVIPYRLGKRRANVATGELLVEGGIGKTGNLFNENNTEHKRYVYGYAEYGLSNNIALRLGVSDLGIDSQSTMVGINVGLLPTLNWDTAYWDNESLHHFATILDYDSKDVSLSYHFNYHQKKSDGEELQSHRLHAHIHASTNWNFSTTGYYAINQRGLYDKYYTATLNTRLHNKVNAQLHKDRNNEYSYRLDWRPNYSNSFGIHGDKDKDGLYARHRFNQDTTTGVSIKKARGKSALFHQAYIEHNFNDKHHLYASYSGYRSHSGYQMDWRYRVNPGLNIYLGYRKNDISFDSFIDNFDEHSIDREYAYLRFNLDLSHTPGVGYKLKPHQYSRKGMVLANVTFDQSLPIDSEKIALKLNKRQVPAQKLDDGKYLIEGVSPGVYKLSLDSKNLPIEYSTQALPQVMVKVDNAATTIVPYHLKKMLGVSGKIVGATIPTEISAYQQSKKIASAITNRFGYYQLLGLVPGAYEIRANGYQSQQVELDKTFLFEVNLER